MIEIVSQLHVNIFDIPHLEHLLLELVVYRVALYYLADHVQKDEPELVEDVEGDDVGVLHGDCYR